MDAKLLTDVNSRWGKFMIIIYFIFHILYFFIYIYSELDVYKFNYKNSEALHI